MVPERRANNNKTECEPCAQELRHSNREESEVLVPILWSMLVYQEQGQEQKLRTHLALILLPYLQVFFAYCIYIQLLINITTGNSVVWVLLSSWLSSYFPMFPM